MASDTAFTTYVFQHRDVDAAKALRTEMFERYSFGGDDGAATTICGVMSGDALSVADALRMASNCHELDPFERAEFAAKLGDQLTWEDCLAVAADWDLQVVDGAFVDASAEQVSA